MRSGSAARQVAGSLTSTGGRSAPTNNFARPCADAARPAKPPAQRSLSALACAEPARPSGRDVRPRPALERRAQSTSASRAPTASTSSGLLHEAPSIPAPRHIAPERLVLIYATLVPPPLATLHALAARIPHANLAGHVELVEQCCVCPSLWDAVAEIGQPPASFGRTGGAVSGYTHFCDPQRLDNTELATLGSTLLGLFATEWLECRYPHLPTGCGGHRRERSSDGSQCARLGGDGVRGTGDVRGHGEVLGRVCGCDGESADDAAIRAEERCRRGMEDRERTAAMGAGQVRCE